MAKSTANSEIFTLSGTIVSDREAALCCALSYCDVPVGVRLDNIEGDVLDKVKVRFGKAALTDELKAWHCISAVNPAKGFQASAYKKGSYVTVAFRGTDDRLDWLNNVLTYIFGISLYSRKAKNYVKKLMKAYPDCRFITAGHSVGGHLAYNAAAAAVRRDKARFGRVVTFNGLGLTAGLTVLADFFDGAVLAKNKVKITNYRVHGDPVSEGFIGKTTKTLGSTVEFERSADAYSDHDMYTFIEKL